MCGVSVRWCGGLLRGEKRADGFGSVWRLIARLLPTWLGRAVASALYLFNSSSCCAVGLAASLLSSLSVIALLYRHLLIGA